MKKLTHLAFAGFIASMLFAIPHTYADDSCNSGYAYEDCRRAPHISPSYALGLVIATGVITLVFTNGNSHGFSNHSHNYSHSHNHS